MTVDEHNDPLLTVTDIAQLTGVGTSAVSNWRKRHAGFPSAADTTDAGKELFRLSEVNTWLRSTHREEIRLDLSELLWQHLRVGRLAEETLLVAAIGGLVLRRRVASRSGHPISLRRMFVADEPRDLIEALVYDAGIPDEFIPAFDALAAAAVDAPELLAAIDAVDPAYAVETADALLTRWAASVSRRSGLAVTNPSIARLAAMLAPDARRLYDPAFGTGGFLTAAIDHIAASDRDATLRISGQELSRDAWSVGVLRLLGRGVDDLDLHIGDSLLEDAEPELRADLVVGDPPYGQVSWGAEQLVGDPRWRFGVPGERDSAAAWLQHALHHLAPDGLGVLVLPTGSLFAPGRSASIRRSMLSAGAILGIVGLPGGLASNTQVPLCVWLLRSPDAPATAQPVLVIDASADEHLQPGRGPFRSLTDDTVERIVASTRTFLAQPGRFADQPGFAIAVPLHTLLTDKHAPLTPQHWVGNVSPDPEELGDQLTQAIHSVRACADDVSEAPHMPLLNVCTPDRPAPALQISDLADAGAVEILRPRRLDKGDYTTSGIPVVTQTVLNRDGTTPKFERFVDSGTAERQTVTRPGDVILATVGERPYAVVDEHGGNVLGGNLEALRIHADWLNPDVVAACLSSSRTAGAVTGTTIPRVRLRDLALPSMTTETMQVVRESVERLRRSEVGARQLAQAAAEARRILVEAIVAGNDITKEGH